MNDLEKARAGKRPILAASSLPGRGSISGLDFAVLQLVCIVHARMADLQAWDRAEQNTLKPAPFSVCPSRLPSTAFNGLLTSLGVLSLQMGLLCCLSLQLIKCFLVAPSLAARQNGCLSVLWGPSSVPLQ